jgi:hypothetical protein
MTPQAWTIVALTCLVLGALALAVGAALVYLPAGIVTCGICSLAFGVTALRELSSDGGDE